LVVVSVDLAVAAGVAKQARAGDHSSAVGAAGLFDERFGAARPEVGNPAAADIVDRAAAHFGDLSDFPLRVLASFEEALDKEDLFDGKHGKGSPRGGRFSPGNRAGR
jgi:hypothetical protein